jgi:hypothetical protein
MNSTLPPVPTMHIPLPLKPNQIRLRDRVVMCFNCNSPSHFARNCTMLADLRKMNTPVCHKQCAKCKRYGHWKIECTPALQLRHSKCYNCGRFGHFHSRCTNRQVFQQAWSLPERAPRPPDPPMPPMPPAPPPPPFQYLPGNAFPVPPGSTLPIIHTNSSQYYSVLGEAVEWKHTGLFARDVGSNPSGGTFISKKPKMKKPRACPPSALGRNR